MGEVSTRQTEAFLAGIQGPEIAPYQDPFDDLYLGRKAGPTQKECWPYIRDTYGAKAALIGGKGGGKTTVAAAMLIERAQKYPGSKSFIAAATYQQAIESCATELVEVADIMGINTVYRKEMVIDRLPHKHVYYLPDYESVICIRSADNMDMIEGSKWDACAIEEVIFWKEADLSTALSRVRRGKGDHAKIIVGLAESEEFWVYDYLNRAGFKLWEVDTRENAQNLPEGYIDDLRRMYPGELGERYIAGRRVNISRQPVQSNYSDEIHRKGVWSRRLTGYDPNRHLYVSFDFNIAPVTVTVWQVKPVRVRVIRREEKTGLQREVKVIKNVICQIDEIEEWMDGTTGACNQFMERYGDHIAGGVVTGDASGDASDTRNPSVTDWSIIADSVGSLNNMVVKKGVVLNRGKATRRKSRRDKPLARYSNPPLRDSILNLNRVLLDGDGHPGIVFLPSSVYESGGCAASVSAVRYKADGSVDEQSDKKEGTVGDKKKRKQTHYWATVRYIVWYLSPPASNAVTDPMKGGRSNYKMEDTRVF